MFIATLLAVAAISSVLNPVHGELRTLGQSSLVCKVVIQMGRAQRCCSVAASKLLTWGKFCNGDLAGNQGCASNQILGTMPSTYPKRSEPVVSGGVCFELYPDKCYLTSWEYVYNCCQCPAGYVVYASYSAQPNCQRGAHCVACTNPNEKLIMNAPNPPQCVATGNCKVNDQGLKAIKLAESPNGVFNPNFYLINGHKTIGFGHDCDEQKDCGSLRPPITETQALALFGKDIMEFQKCVGKLPNASELNTNQFAALVSFTYHSGCSGVSRFFRSYMEKKDFSGICRALPTTNLTDNPKLRQGFINRRQKEAALCSEPTNVMSGC